MTQPIKNLVLLTFTPDGGVEVGMKSLDFINHNTLWLAFNQMTRRFMEKMEEAGRVGLAKKIQSHRIADKPEVAELDMIKLEADELIKNLTEKENA